MLSLLCRRLVQIQSGCSKNNASPKFHLSHTKNHCSFVAPKISWIRFSFWQCIRIKPHCGYHPWVTNWHALLPSKMAASIKIQSSFNFLIFIPIVYQSNPSYVCRGWKVVTTENYAQDLSEKIVWNNVTSTNEWGFSSITYSCGILLSYMIVVILEPRVVGWLFRSTLGVPR